MATGRGKARKNSTATINEPDATGNTTDDGHGNANQSAPIELSMHNPLMTLHDVGDDRDDDLPAVVLCDVQAGGPLQHGVKWKPTDTVDSKPSIPSRRTFLLILRIPGQPPEAPTVTYHLKVASHSELKKQPAKRDNKARILKLSLTFPWVQMQDAILDKVAEVLKISTLTLTYHDFEVLFTVARKISDPTPLQSNDDYEVLIENIEKMSNPAASIFVCALKVCDLLILWYSYPQHHI